MALTQNLNGQMIALGNTRPQGLVIGKQNPNRKLINWQVPNKGLVQMYINPQSLDVTERKIIKPTRTKGGYLIQYWGEEMPEINISGTTGSGGIEGINVLHDVYRQEQLAFNDLFKQANNGFLNNLVETILGININLSNNPLSTVSAGAVLPSTNPDSFFNQVVNAVGNIANVFDAFGNAISSDQQLIPTLAALATSVEMWYDNKVYRGFFKSFAVHEKADEVGIFRYDINFSVTRQSGIRSNGFAWQRSVNYGPANSDTVPLTFGGLVVPTNSTPPSTNSPSTATAPSISRRSLLTG